MNQKEFKAMIDDNDYHFFIFSCPAITPFNFVIHPWIVIKYPDGKTERRELGHFKNEKEPALWYIFRNFLPPWKWITKYFWKTNQYFESSLCYHCSGKSDSLTYKIISFIEEHVEQYPNKNEYRLIWKNSNSFMQWILQGIPKIPYKLPWNAIGK